MSFINFLTYLEIIFFVKLTPFDIKSLTLFRTGLMLIGIIYNWVSELSLSSNESLGKIVKVKSVVNFNFFKLKLKREKMTFLKRWIIAVVNEKLMKS
jgi:hypothetical protein